MNGIAELIQPETVIARLDVPSRELALRGMANALAGVVRLQPGRIVRAVRHREQLGGTGIGEGVALPHATIESLSGPVCAFARLAQPMDFGALDGRPADLVVMLLAPRRGGQHLKALASLSRVLRRADVRARLRAARSHGDLCAILGVGLASDAA